MVGKGTYGTVYKAEVRLHGKKQKFFYTSSFINNSKIGIVALKELNFISPTETQFQAFRNEVFALKFVLLFYLFIYLLKYSIFLPEKLHIKIH